MIFWNEDFPTRLRFLYLSKREKGEWPSAKSCKKVWPRIHAFKTLASRFLPDKHKLYWLRSRSRIKTQSCGLLWAIFLFTEVQFLQQQKKKKEIESNVKTKKHKTFVQAIRWTWMLTTARTILSAIGIRTVLDQKIKWKLCRMLENQFEYFRNTFHNNSNTKIMLACLIE